MADKKRRKSVNKMLVVLLIILLTTSLRSQWYSVNSGVSVDLNSIYFANETIGWIVGDDGKILKSNDGGNSWFQQTNLAPPPFNTYPLFSVFAVDTLLVFAKGYGEILLKTSDAGTNWNKVGDISTMPYIRKGPIFFVDSLVGWMADNDASTLSYRSIYKTIDGGLHWNKKYTGSNNTVTFSHIYFVNKDTGWIASSVGVLRTFDGGTNWTNILSGGINELKIISNDLYAVSTESDFTTWLDSSYIFKGTDLGDSWELLAKHPFEIISLDFADSKKGWAITDSSWLGGSKRQLRSTINNGFTWTSQINDSLKDFNVVYFIDDKNGFIIGDDGLLLKTNNSGGITSIEVNENKKNNFVLEQNFPNPFNPLTKINFTVPESKFVQIKVYDLLGKEVKVLVSEYKKSGMHEVEFDAKYLSSGIYFYRIVIDKYSQTRKMLLIK